MNLREACETANENIIVALDKTTSLKHMGPAVFDCIARCYERHLTPVVQALVGAAYAACAKYVSEWNDGLNETQCIMRGSLGWKEQKRGIFSVEEGILSLTPEAAAKELARRELQIRLEELNGLPDVDMMGLDTYVGERAMRLERALAALSKPAPAVEPEKR